MEKAPGWAPYLLYLLPSQNGPTPGAKPSEAMTGLPWTSEEPVSPDSPHPQPCLQLPQCDCPHPLSPPCCATSVSAVQVGGAQTQGRRGIFRGGGRTGEVPKSSQRRREAGEDGTGWGGRWSTDRTGESNGKEVCAGLERGHPQEERPRMLGRWGASGGPGRRSLGPPGPIITLGAWGKKVTQDR